MNENNIKEIESILEEYDLLSDLNTETDIHEDASFFTEHSDELVELFNITDIGISSTHQFLSSVNKARLHSCFGVLWGYYLIYNHPNHRQLSEFEKYCLSLSFAIIYNGLLETLAARVSYYKIPPLRLLNRASSLIKKGNILDLMDWLGIKIEEAEYKMKLAADDLKEKSQNETGIRYIESRITELHFRYYQYILSIPRIIGGAPEKAFESWSKDDKNKIKLILLIGKFVSRNSISDNRKRISKNVRQTIKHIQYDNITSQDIDYLKWYIYFIKQFDDILEEEQKIVSAIEKILKTISRHDKNPSSMENNNDYSWE